MVNFIIELNNLLERAHTVEDWERITDSDISQNDYAEEDGDVFSEYVKSAVYLGETGDYRFGVRHQKHSVMRLGQTRPEESESYGLVAINSKNIFSYEDDERIKDLFEKIRMSRDDPVLMLYGNEHIRSPATSTGFIEELL